MNTESPRLRALLAAGAALVVFGITIPATAAPDASNPNRPGVGEVGQAQFKADPKGQYKNDHNNGFTCDGNKGAGVAGNPALPHNCGTPPPVGNSEPDTNTDPNTDPGPGEWWSGNN
ncbi:MAG: hypothetical protein AVDCRST_MAG47-2586 [uncultured Nocardioidaceae bacterium]|uniref:Uncharacterized protein n=1 Tax=uncultured Nocardioidaceae bacterium TaxID=253824 RepID=A0A6J4NG64_9ACTN|nr:MAG: hypothetical protein AVDCRST_MAG47-2586 [uncultured Nocardioidaceae bacterium]